MIDLGGSAWQGRVRVIGEPRQPVRIELPSRVVLKSPDGAEALLTDLAGVAMLDDSGMLEFAFGARLTSQAPRPVTFAVGYASKSTISERTGVARGQRLSSAHGLLAQHLAARGDQRSHPRMAPA
jgi:hypothetical protein